MSQYVYFSRKNPCPVCNTNSTRCCKLDNDKWVICHKVFSEKRCKSGGYLHLVKDEPIERNTTRSDKVTQVTLPYTPSLSPVLLDKMCRRLLELSPLSASHQKYLKEAGLPQTFIKPCGSIKITERKEKAAVLVKEFGKEACLASPLVKTSLELTAFYDGLLMPIIGLDGLIKGITYRLDQPIDGKRYRNMSADGKFGKPHGVIIQPVTNKVIITEGYKKAAVASTHFKLTSLWFVGVHLYDIEKVIEDLDRLNAREVLIAFDQDKWNKPEVLEAESRLIKLLHEKRPSLVIRTLEWDIELGKGIDDAIIANQPFTSFRESLKSFVIPGLPVDQLIDARYMPDLNVFHKVTMVKAAKGTGKSQMVKRLIKEIKKITNKAILSVNHRVSLSKAQAQEWGLDLYLDYKGKDNGFKEMNRSKELVICVNSLPQLDLGKIGEIDLLVFDEIEQILAHLTGKTCKENRQQILATLKHLVKMAKHIVCLDADLGATTYEFFRKLVGAENIEVIVNTYIPTGKTIVAHGKIDSCYVEAKNQLEAGRKIYLTINSLEETKKVFRIFQEAFPDKRGWLVNSEEVDQETQDKIAKINDTVLELDYLVCSPTLGTGVSIDVSHFDTVFLVGFAGVNTQNDLLQQILRVRKPRGEKIHCWISPERKYLPTRVEEIKEDAIRNLEETGLHIEYENETHRRIVASYEQEYLDLWAAIRAERNESWLDLRANFYRQAELEGHKVTQAEELAKTELKEIREEKRQAKLEIKQEDLAEIEIALDLSEDQAKRLKEKPHKNRAEKAALARYDIRRFYGRADRATIEFDNRGKGRSAVKNVCYMMNRDLAIEADRHSFEKDQVMLTDISHNVLRCDAQKHLLRDLGLLSENAADDKSLLEQLFQEFSDESLKATGVVEKLKASKKDYERILSCSINLNSPVQVASYLARQFGWKLDCRQVKTGRKNENGKPEIVRYYSINQGSFKQVQQRAFERMKIIESRQQVELLLAA